MSEGFADEALHVLKMAREILGDFAVIMRDEWNSRTKLGKALYPLWAFDSAMQWLTVLFFLCVMVIVDAFVKVMSKPTAPSIYKEKND